MPRFGVSLGPPRAQDMSDGPQFASPALFHQAFSSLEEALQYDVWTFDSDGPELYEDSGAAVLLAQGDSNAEATLVHELADGEGARIDRLTCDFACEGLERDSNSIFTVGLAFNEDLEEAALLAITLRRLRPDPGDPESTAPPPALPQSISLVLNGLTVVEDIGELPVRVEVDVALDWDAGARRACMRYRLSPAAPGAACHIDGEAFAEFYTSGVRYDKATALFFRGQGSQSVRLHEVACWAAAAHGPPASDDAVEAADP